MLKHITSIVSDSVSMYNLCSRPGCDRMYAPLCVGHCPLNLLKTKTKLDCPRVAATYRTGTPSARFLCAYECAAKLGVGILVAVLS